MRTTQLKNVVKVACGIFLLNGGIALAQDVKPVLAVDEQLIVKQDTIKVFEKEVILNESEVKFPQFKLGGVFQGRFVNSFEKDVDINGLHHSDGTGTHNSFEIKRMRVSLRARITNNLEVNTLVNFADFKSKDVSTRVLENAYAKYTFNRYLQVTVGQFRPLFGLEETYAVDIVKSIDYSNSYYLFGANGWTSFQIGAAFTGNVDLGKVPMSYGVSITNGNGKNTTDNDDGKLYSSRLLFNVDKKNEINVGISGGIGEVQKHQVYAFGLEAAANFHIDEKWSIDFQTEYKQGTNHSDFFKQKPDVRIGVLDDYLMESFYILPNVRYVTDIKHLYAVEFSCRYEYLNPNAHLSSTQLDGLNSSSRQTITPMLSLKFIRNYGARLQLGFEINNYKKNFKDTTNYNSNLAFVQLQCRL